MAVGASTAAVPAHPNDRSHTRPVPVSLVRPPSPHATHNRHRRPLTTAAAARHRRYPIAEEPRHNDNVWFARGRFKLLRQRVLSIPDNVQKILIEQGKAVVEGRGSHRTATFAFLSSRLWSDHRPVYADLET